MPLRAKSKLSASERSDSASISSGSLSITAHLSSASALVAAETVLTSWVTRTQSGLRPEALAATALAGLDDDGVSLRGARHGERPARTEEPALVVQAMDLLRMGEQARRLILDDGVVLPSVPMAEHDLHELVGAVVALIMRHHLVAPHVPGFAVVQRGDHVPGRAPLAHQIERGEHARHVKRLVVAGRIGRAQAEPLGRHAHHSEHRDSIELHAADAVAHRVGVVVPVHVRHRQPVIEEAEVEFAFLEHAAEVAVVVRRPGIGARLRVAPGAREVGAVLRLQEGDQGHLAHRRSPSKSSRPDVATSIRAWGAIKKPA
jgi:hypothetical protein